MGLLVMTGSGQVTTLSPAKSLPNSTPVTGRAAARFGLLPHSPVISSESSLTLWITTPSDCEAQGAPDLEASTKEQCGLEPHLGALE